MAEEIMPGRLNASPAEVVEDLIFGRRSIRRYKDRPLPQAWIDAILRCGHQAPSPSNRQPVRFVRIQSPHYRHRLRTALATGCDGLLTAHRSVGAPARLKNRIKVYRRYAETMFAAPVLLAVGIDTETMGFADYLVAGGLMRKNKANRVDPDMTVGLALQGMMLKAHALGLGSCILTAPLVFIDDVEYLLGLQALRINCFLTLGFPDEAPRPSERIPLDAVTCEI